MAAPICELCGGSEFVKSDGMFVCQGCGTKYSPEEAQKLMKEDGAEDVVSAVAKGVQQIGEALQQTQDPQHPHHEGPHHGEAHHEGHHHGDRPHDDWHGEELRSGADFNAQAVNINAAGPRGVNNYVCQAWQLIIDEYNTIEHPNKQQFDALVSRAKECLMLLNSAAMLDPNNNVQNFIIFDNCMEIEESVKEAKYWEQAEDGSWTSDTLSFFDDVKAAGQSEGWEEKRDAHQDALEQIFFAGHPNEVAQKQQLQEEAAGIQEQLNELKDEKRSKGLFNFKEKGEVKERMRPVKDQLAQVNSQIREIDNAAEDYAEQQVKAASNAFVRLDF